MLDNRKVILFLGIALGLVAGRFYYHHEEAQKLTLKVEPFKPVAEEEAKKDLKSRERLVTRTLASVVPTVAEVPKKPIQQMSVFELTQLSNNARINLKNKYLESYAPVLHYYTGKEDGLRLLATVRQAMQDMRLQSPWWKAESTFREAGHEIELTSFMKMQPLIEGSGDDGRLICDQFMYMIRIDGKSAPLYQHAAADCGPYTLRSPDASTGLYYNIDLFDDSHAGSVLALLLIPLPAPSAPAKYFANPTDGWTNIPDFKWQPSTQDEEEAAESVFSRGSADASEQ